jgi:hypothetical protein
MGPCRSQHRLRQRIEQSVEAFDDLGLGPVGMNTESENDQIEPVVSTPSAIPVHDASDRAIGRENIPEMQIAVHGIIAG